MRAKSSTLFVFTVITALFLAPAWAQVEVTVEELDIGGDPPGLEGMPG